MREQDPFRARSPVALRAFEHYLRWYVHRNFHALRLSRTGVPVIADGRPLIICSNHPGWWDPVLFILLQRILMRDRIGFGPMEAKALGKYGILRKMGAFGVEPDTHRGAKCFLRTGLRILANPKAVLWVTAEGQFCDPRRRPVQLRNGIAHLARRAPNVVILPLALEYVFWTERKPEALIHFGAPVEARAERSAASWTASLEAALTCAMDALAAESMSRNPALFVPLLRGSAGVGGVYDMWRRASALIGGYRFDPRHGGEE